MEVGFDSVKYLKIQSEKILERIKMFDGKLYLKISNILKWITIILSSSFKSSLIYIHSLYLYKILLLHK